MWYDVCYHCGEKLFEPLKVLCEDCYVDMRVESKPNEREEIRQEQKKRFSYLNKTNTTKMEGIFFDNMEELQEKVRFNNIKEIRKKIQLSFTVTIKIESTINCHFCGNIYDLSGLEIRENFEEGEFNYTTERLSEEINKSEKLSVAIEECFNDGWTILTSERSTNKKFLVCPTCLENN